MFKKALGAYCIITGRNFATPDDFKFLAPIVLEHRLKFHPGAGDPKEAFQELVKPVVEKAVSLA